MMQIISVVMTNNDGICSSFVFINVYSSSVEVKVLVLLLVRPYCVGLRCMSILSNASISHECFDK